MTESTMIRASKDTRKVFKILIVIAIFIGTYITSLISGMFATAGGGILMAIYSLLLPVSVAMVLHGFTQAFSNGFRTWLFREHIVWRILPPYILGATLAVGLFAWLAFVPEKYIVFLSLGVFSILPSFMPKLEHFSILNKYVGVVSGCIITITQFICGVSGPILDIFYIHSGLNRFQIVANKSLTQTFAHFIKLIYFAIMLEESIQVDFTLPYWIIPVIIVLTFLGARSGKFLLHHINEELFRKITRMTIAALGFFMIYKGIIELQTTNRLPTLLAWANFQK